jgi:nucleotide-binding universal stress UspA family protein
MPRPFSRILHPTDFSPASAAALASALALAKAGRAKLVLLHVLTPPSPFVGDDVVPARTYEELEAGARRGARRELARRVARARRAGVPAAGVIVDGVAFEEITRFAKRKGVDLIVMGTHGRTGLPRLFMGSVAERVLQRAPCSVLTARGK